MSNYAICHFENQIVPTGQTILFANFVQSTDYTNMSICEYVDTLIDNINNYCDFLKMNMNACKFLHYPNTLKISYPDLLCSVSISFSKKLKYRVKKIKIVITILNYNKSNSPINEHVFDCLFESINNLINKYEKCATNYLLK